MSKKKLTTNKNILQNIFLLIGVLFLFYCVYLSSASVRIGEIGFNTDLARDFLLLQDINETQKLTLIGPRSGGIAGVFHGPLWVYLNLPAYIFGNGNPIIVGWFWVGLFAAFVFFVYYIGKKLFDRNIGMLSAILSALAILPSTSSFFNPLGAVLLAPIFFYLLYKYLLYDSNKFLIACLFILGLIIQFQIAFGGPMLILTSFLIFYKVFKTKHYRQLFSFLIILIPLSSYILFDIRHDFLQLRAVLSYLNGGNTGVQQNYSLSFFEVRGREIFNSFVGPFYYNIYFSITILLMAVYSFYRSFKEKDTTTAKIFLLYIYLFFGYWLITLLYKGVIWGYYYIPFIPLNFLILAGTRKYINKYVYGICMALFIITLFNNSYASATNYTAKNVGHDSSSWLFNYETSKKVFSEGDTSFGYYVFSPDQYGYSQKYAMNYVSKQYPNIKAVPFKKEKITYLLIAPPGGKNQSIGGDWWKKHKVNINKKPTKTIKFENGYVIEKYILTEEEIAIPSDPNLIDSLIFR